MWNFVSGEFVDSEEKIFASGHRILKYGDGFFESIKVSNGEALYLDLHLSRIERSFVLLKMERRKDWNLDFFKAIINELCKRNKCDNARLRIQFYRTSKGFYLPEDRSCDFIIQFDPLKSPNYLSKEVHNLDIYKEMYKTSNFSSMFKTTSCLEYVLASIYAEENGNGDCLLINEKEHICEATSSNVFIVKDNKIITPPLSEYCVDGVMRKVILEMATAYGYNCLQIPIEEGDLYLADELFLTNAVSGIIPVMDFRGKKYTKAYSAVLQQMLQDRVS
jgi:branched-chain amino acid aminotransferase